MTTTTVADSYVRRARFCRAETTAVRRPRLLRGLLNMTRHVAEIPCGAGHFLTDYHYAAAAVTLVDACADMLATAVGGAHEIGLRDICGHHATAQNLPTLPDIDLVVLPNGALNQLARQTPPDRLLAGLCSALRPGTEVLAQVACTHPSGGTDNSTFYDPNRQHTEWFTDRWFHPEQASGAVRRRRRQHRAGNDLRIEFDYRSATGQRLHATAVELTLLSPAQLVAAFTTAGFAHVGLLAGHNGLSELLTATPNRTDR